MKQWFALALASVLLLAGCSDNKPEKPPYPGIKIGKPYQIYGRWYKPHYELDYDEIGVASWYGPGFHGGKTADGERFNENDYTAAHRTLPLPSIVRVTNLNNGKSMLVRVNDRGPFSRDRIIDLSKAAASALGIIGPGSAKVRVQFLDKETREYVQDSNNHDIDYAMHKLKNVDPEQAAELQEKDTKPQFYVMKVPEGVKPPPQSVRVSEKDAAHYPTGDIFAMADKEDQEEAHYDVSQEEMPVQPVRHTQEHYLTAPHSPPLVVEQAHYEPESRPSRGGAVFIQVGTFSNKQNAEHLADKFEAQYAPEVINTVIKGKTFYRVVMGPYKQSADAKNMLSKLSALGIPDAHIVHE